MRYIHPPAVVKVNGVDEYWYCVPMYDPSKLPTTEIDNALAMPYERCTPFVKNMILRSKS
jgi:hypothetical protein